MPLQFQEGPSIKGSSAATHLQLCADVCPNRANVVVKLPDGRRQIVHVNRTCNKCGNCLVFCPYTNRPYKEKFTISLNKEAFADSTNQSILQVHWLALKNLPDGYNAQQIQPITRQIDSKRAA